MNRKLLALAVGAALALPMVAQAAPTVYGQLNMTVDKVSTTQPGGPDQWQVNSNSSRLGLMGEEALGSGLSAVYKIEYGVAGDVAGSNDLTGRDRFLGLKGSFGTFKLGAYDSPLKSSQGMVDQFNDGVYSDMTVAGGIVGDNRMNNVIGYESPVLANAVTVKLALQPGENNTDNGPAEAISAAVAYEASGLYAALAYDSKVADGGFTPAAARNTLRLSGTYTMNALQLGALLQSSEVDDETLAAQDDQKALLLSAGYNLDDHNTVKGQFIYTTDDFGAGTDKQKRMAFEAGVDHNFTKMTKVFGQAAYAKTNNLNGGTSDADDSVLTVGMLTKF